jgi:hypothetical protein
VLLARYSPAATTGMFGAASTTAGTNGKVLRKMPCPPPSAPWATRMWVITPLTGARTYIVALAPCLSICLGR